ncbi:hypothetical protein [Polymorphum gilvum]|uniref:N-acetyltransferase domain-containing protein n=1 Tax=Polymorphum gilvum (strain LMG 25793 / CGMCC 1.9160 / SL003B-26A1) TaxID=991905 RepID=F2IX96_POLGS|nr:hypothetical protein [Polymorphum gilvum]ADZ70414.1 hypothetical protein SL003B_1988 [Polymorphum gilvum SL003B-26A1]
MLADVTEETTLDVVRAIARLEGRVRACGLTLRESADFAAFEAAVATTQDRYLMEDFSSRFFDLHGAQAFWIGARDEAGAVVSVQAAKVEDLRDRTLAEHWRQQQRRLFVDPAAEAELGTDHARDAFFMHGRIAYHGNLWLRKDFRGRGLAETLTQIGFLVALAKWSPDYLYGLMAAANALKGFGLRVGYRRFVPRGTHWIAAPSHIRPDDWLVYSTRADLITLAATIAVEGPE